MLLLANGIFLWSSKTVVCLFTNSHQIIAGKKRTIYLKCFALWEPTPPLDFWDKGGSSLAITVMEFVSKVERWDGFYKCKNTSGKLSFFPTIIWCEFVNKQITVFEDRKKIPLVSWQPRNNQKNCLAETKLPGAPYSVHGNFILTSTT